MSHGHNLSEVMNYPLASIFSFITHNRKRLGVELSQQLTIFRVAQHGEAKDVEKLLKELTT